MRRETLPPYLAGAYNPSLTVVPHSIPYRSHSQRASLRVPIFVLVRRWRVVVHRGHEVIVDERV